MRSTQLGTIALLLALAFCAFSCGDPSVFGRAIVIDSIFDAPTGSGSPDQVIVRSYYVEGAEGKFTTAEIPEGWQSLPRGPFVEGQSKLSTPLMLSWTPWELHAVRDLRDPVTDVRRARLPRELHSDSASQAEQADVASNILDLGGDAYRARLSETTTGAIVVNVALDGAVKEPSSPNGVGWVELSSWTYDDLRTRNGRQWRRAGGTLFAVTGGILYLGIPIYVWVLILT